MGASASNSIPFQQEPEADYKAIMQQFYDIQLVSHITEAYHAAFANTCLPLQYADQCTIYFDAFYAICKQFGNQEKFGKVYGREDYLSPIAEFKKKAATETAKMGKELSVDVVTEILKDLVDETMRKLNPSQTVESNN